MKHKHYDMICAKAANTKLVVFVFIKTGSNGVWYEKNNQECQWWEDFNYFLCLPQHKEACLNWLNGGISQVEYTHASYPYWTNIDCDEVNWSGGHIFMDGSVNIRIKPKKEKRWIGVDVKTGQTTSSYKDYEDVVDRVRLTKGGINPNWQIIEIEVEV